ncbi:MAG: 3-phosphoglycerate dehydrogenase [Candidatus Rokubacteria bacterium]|nr:3-phosphoglycerate dehydrogenase [Candidatus Rokubacteria bacterium]MBI2553996.1 3-phosphoglycerate dehydrogenase [Candidatus Rokubacteria bacterium]
MDWVVLYLNRATKDLYRVMGEEAPPELRLLFLDAGGPDEIREKLPQADAILIADAALTAEMILRASRLKMVQHQGVGYERIDVKALAKAGVPLALCPAGTAEAVGEHTVLLMLAALKRLVAAHASMVAGQWLMWELRPSTRDLHGKTVGLIGFGRTGRAVAKRLRGFDVRLIVNDPYITLSEREKAEFGVTLVEKDALLREADIVSLHVPLTEETRHLIAGPELQRMKREAVLINVSRGGVTDQDALYEALRERRILGAGLDVYSPEPLPAGHPLTRLDNVVLTPHVAAGTLDAFRAKMRFALGNIARFKGGEEPLERAPTPSARVPGT